MTGAPIDPNARLMVKSGQNLLSGDERALFETLVSGEVMTIFEAKNIMSDLHEVSTIEYGKADSFPIIGNVEAAYHKQGIPLLGNNVQHGELIINVDGLLVAHVWIYDLVKAMAKHDFRAKYTKKLGEALAKKYDKQVLQTIALAARAASTLDNEGFGGTILYNDGFKTDKADIAAGLFLAQQTFNEKDVPEEDRYFVCLPSVYSLIFQNFEFINTLYGGGDNGNIKDGNVFKVAGLNIKWSNNVPSSTVLAEDGTMNTYHGDFSKTAGVAFHREAVATVKLLDLTVESQRKTEYKSDIVTADYAVGHGILRPECAIEFSAQAAPR